MALFDVINGLTSKRGSQHRASPLVRPGHPLPGFEPASWHLRRPMKRALGRFRHGREFVISELRSCPFVYCELQ